ESLPRPRREVSLSVIHVTRRARSVCRELLRSLHAHLDRVNQAVADSWRKRQAVFMPHKLRNFRVSLVKFFGIPGEIRAPACSLGHPLQELVRLFELLFSLRGAWDGRFLLAGGWRISQSTRQGNCQQTYVAGPQPLNRFCRIIRRRSVQAGGKQDNRFFPRDICEALEDLQHTGGQVYRAK